MISDEYIQDKVQEVHNMKIENEEDAKAFIKKMDYIHYLHGDNKYDHRMGVNSHSGIEVENFNDLLTKEGQAWEMIKDEEIIFQYIIYPLHHKIWKEGFDHLRALESFVIRGEISKKQYAIMIENFNNNVLGHLNKEAHKYGFANHTLFWIQSLPLKIDMREYGIK